MKKWIAAMLAVCLLAVPAGAADIVFTYHTPGLALSAGVSLTGLAVYAGYLLLLHFKRKRKQNADPC